MTVERLRPPKRYEKTKSIENPCCCPTSMHSTGSKHDPAKVEPGSQHDSAKDEIASIHDPVKVEPGSKHDPAKVKLCSRHDSAKVDEHAVNE